MQSGDEGALKRRKLNVDTSLLECTPNGGPTGEAEPSADSARPAAADNGPQRQAAGSSAAGTLQPPAAQAQPAARQDPAGQDAAAKPSARLQHESTAAYGREGPAQVPNGTALARHDAAASQQAASMDLGAGTAAVPQPPEQQQSAGRPDAPGAAADGCTLAVPSEGAAADQQAASGPGALAQQQQQQQQQGPGEQQRSPGEQPQEAAAARQQGPGQLVPPQRPQQAKPPEDGQQLGHDASQQQLAQGGPPEVRSHHPEQVQAGCQQPQQQQQQGLAQPAAQPAEPAQPAAEPTVLGYTSGAHTQRELFLQGLERAGEMSFEYVRNDSSRQSSIWLIALKNIFSKQLPNMPKEYIARLVLDRRHRSVAIVRGTAVVGGITYRPFHDRGFGEIAFCAVTASEQVKGFGTRLMNWTKSYAVANDRLSHFLTYADNNAVGYFAKQGFTKEITLARERWVGWIKDYDGGTLMECVLLARLPYSDLPGMVRAQREALDSRIRGLSNSHVVHPGLPHFRDGPRRKLDIGAIPGVREAGWTPAEQPAGFRVRLPDGQLTAASPGSLQAFMAQALEALRGSPDAWPFREPVSTADVPDYLDVIKDPVDLQLIGERLSSGDYYLTLEIFAADVRRMLANCRTYNSAETLYFKAADRLEAFFDDFMRSHVVLELQAATP